MTSVPAPVLAALSRLNAHARVRRPYGLPRVIYAYKVAATVVLARHGEVSARLVRWIGKCNRCTDGRFRHWDWEDGYSVACRDCGGTGRRTLRFTETTLPGGQVWHHPWYAGDGRGADIARHAIPGLHNVDAWDYVDGAGNPVPWHEAEDWAPNLPGVELDLDTLVRLLNIVEAWVEALPDTANWLVHAARRNLCQHRHRGVVAAAPSHAYALDLGRAPGGCFVCGETHDIAGFAYGRMTPLFHWSLPVCRRHGEGPEKVGFPSDPPPDALVTAPVREWLARHERVEDAP